MQQCRVSLVSCFPTLKGGLVHSPFTTLLWPSVFPRAPLQNMECTAACATRAASLLSRTLEKITAAADLAARGK